MKKYRVSYDRHLLLSHRYENGFDYKGEHIMGLSVYFEISVFEGEGDKEKEIFFTSQDGKTLEEERFKFCDDENSPIIFYHNLSDAFYFYVDSSENLGYKLKLSNIAKNSKYNFKIKPDRACKWIGSWNSPIVSTPVTISHDEFVDILTSHIAMFDDSDNKPAQNCSYSINEVKTA